MSDKENKSVEVGSKAKADRLAFFKNKQNLVIVAVVVFVLLLAVVPILIQVISDNGDDQVKDNPDTGEVISGTYSMELQNAGASEYIFDGNKVTNVYNGNTIEYTYVIAIENGVKVIKLTTVDDDGNQKTTTHEFERGKSGDTPIILINDVIYYQKESK